MGKRIPYIPLLPKPPLLSLDQAHSIGAVGGTGRGVTELLGVPTKEVDAGSLRVKVLVGHLFEKKRRGNKKWAIFSDVVT